MATEAAISPEAWTGIAEKSVLALVVLVAIIYGTPLLRWILSTYVPSKQVAAAAGMSSVYQVDNQQLIVQVLGRMDKNSEATMTLAQNVATLTEATNRSYTELIRLFESQQAQTNRIEAAVTRIESRR